MVSGGSQPENHFFLQNVGQLEKSSSCYQKLLKHHFKDKTSNKTSFSVSNFIFKYGSHLALFRKWLFFLFLAISHYPVLLTQQLPN